MSSEIAGLLAAHEYALGMKRGSICTCGHVPTVDPGSLKTQQDYHRHHLADLLAARDRRVRAEAVREYRDALAGNESAEFWSRREDFLHDMTDWATCIEEAGA